MRGAQSRGLNRQRRRAGEGTLDARVASPESGDHPPGVPADRVDRALQRRRTARRVVVLPVPPFAGNSISRVQNHRSVSDEAECGRQPVQHVSERAVQRPAPKVDQGDAVLVFDIDHGALPVAKPGSADRGGQAGDSTSVSTDATSRHTGMSFQGKRAPADLVVAD